VFRCLSVPALAHYLQNLLPLAALGYLDQPEKYQRPLSFEYVVGSLLPVLLGVAHQVEGIVLYLEGHPEFGPELEELLQLPLPRPEIGRASCRERGVLMIAYRVSIDRNKW